MIKAILKCAYNYETTFYQIPSANSQEAVNRKIDQIITETKRDAVDNNDEALLIVYYTGRGRNRLESRSGAKVEVTLTLNGG